MTKIFDFTMIDIYIQKHQQWWTVRSCAKSLVGHGTDYVEIVILARTSASTLRARHGSCNYVFPYHRCICYVPC
ncbi:hypothetical protein Bca52824_084542 [Brassica carinata]|uniref:Uncharacterized protein n=1 Tax=Brassica carinata TaxID=52824 RepID=A0A8X7TWA8_BRACI|nr:hypothetical protein Bca52824_084542 [Brassica carinata]